MTTRCVLSLCALIVLMSPSAGAEQIIAARYAQPVERYGHYALGRPHEYARLVATTDAGREVVLDLPMDEVFEDIAPRLVQLAEQAPPELLVIVSSRDGGSRLALVGLGNRLEIVAESAPIGRSNRWLNPVGVADLNGDGEAEIAAVTTPHIGGVLRVYRRSNERLVEIDSLSGFSNHVYGSPELDLSKPSLIDGRMQLLVPDGRRESVRVIMLSDTGLVETDRCLFKEPITDPEALRECERRLNPDASITHGVPGTVENAGKGKRKVLRGIPEWSSMMEPFPGSTYRRPARFGRGHGPLLHGFVQAWCCGRGPWPRQP